MYTYKSNLPEMQMLNFTMQNLSNIFVAVRQLEFALLQLQRELNDLMYVLESFMIGRLPISLFTPGSLLNILRNVSLHLPEGYSFVIDLNVNNMFLYYEYIKLMAYADFKSIKVVMSVPLKTADRHFVLYKIIALPVPILNNTKFVKFTTDFLILPSIRMRDISLA
jgi:hypothetical protein